MEQIEGEFWRIVEAPDQVPACRTHFQPNLHRVPGTGTNKAVSPSSLGLAGFEGLR